MNGSGLRFAYGTGTVPVLVNGGEWYWQIPGTDFIRRTYVNHGTSIVLEYKNNVRTYVCMYARTVHSIQKISFSLFLGPAPFPRYYADRIEVGRVDSTT